MPIAKSDTAGEVIKDFVHSDDPKFSGDDKEQRIKRALGAYYGKHPEKSRKAKNESVTEAFMLHDDPTHVVHTERDGKPGIVYKVKAKSDDHAKSQVQDALNRGTSITSVSKIQNESVYMKENIEAMIGQIQNGDQTSAAASFHEIIMDKVAARLEDLKVDIARRHFNLGGSEE